jgi:hypothetical protein
VTAVTSAVAAEEDSDGLEVVAWEEKTLQMRVLIA